ncbi:sensor histidine kinase [Lachnospiraceae bacterium C1.1]|nr:ATP-binding protein [Lachnospiraceae bacterium C1.1]
MNSFAMVTEVFDKTSEIICFFDSEGLIRYMNQSGKNELKAEVMETNIREILPNFFPQDTDIFSFISSQTSEEIKADAYRKNHSCFPVKMKVFIADNISGKEMGICIITDIRDYDLQEKQKKKMEEEMKEVLKAQDTFVANLTHELRTPVNGIKGHINNLKADEEDAGKRRTMNIVLNCCENMEKIIDNLLDYAKIENDKMEIQEEKFSLYKLIDDCINTSISVANEKGLNLTSHIADNVPNEVTGDEFRLSQVINNLINNALKFTSMGHVALEVYKTKQSGKTAELTFFVMDTGIGMSEEDKDKLFKSFTQADGSITRKYGGTGLGLYVCKQIVELMGGHIEVDSEKGKGSTFIFTVNLGCENEDGADGEELTIEDLKSSLIFDREHEDKEEMLEYGNPRNLGIN